MNNDGGAQRMPILLKQLKLHQLPKILALTS